MPAAGDGRRRGLNKGDTAADKPVKGRRAWWRAALPSVPMSLPPSAPADASRAARPGWHWLPWRSHHLSTRLVGLFLLLLLTVQVASYLAIHHTIAGNARTAIDEDLRAGERALQRLLAHNAARQLDSARLLAADHGFVAAVVDADTETVISALANSAERVNAQVAALLDTRGQLRASTRPSMSPHGVAERLSAQAKAGQSPTRIEVVDGKPVQFVLVPMKAPVLVGWVLMGFSLDAQLAADLRSISGVKLALLTREGPGWREVFTTLQPAAAQALAAGLQQTALPDRRIDLSGDEYSARALPLGSDDGRSPVAALLMRSVDEALAPFRQLQWVLAGFTLLGVLAMALGSVLTARRVTTPLARLTRAAERLAAGDYDTPIQAVRSDDEVGVLARRFELMRRSIAQQQDEILKLAYWDRLTGLPNRARFREAVQTAIARDGAQRIAVLMLDLDRFKDVNEVLGYRVGDLLLKAVAQRLQQHTLRGDDLVARLGADEFAVLLPGADGVAAQAIAQRIAHAFESPLTLEDHTVDLGAGIGIACWPEHASDADQLLSRAEIAMHGAKRRTQGPLMFSSELESKAVQTLGLLSELRQAIDQGELRLYLQPKVALDDGQVCGAEALVRWQHPRRGLVPPMQFIPFAEQTGFIRQLTLWVFEEAARQWSVLQQEGLRLRMSVNLSTRDLLVPDLPEQLDQCLRRHRVPADAFCLEITESAIMDDPARAEATLNRLHALGFKLAIDDFGTGYSSLAYLKRLPVDELKIDKSFVMAMERDADDAKIVRSTIDLAHNLGLSVVAEGVENQAVWQQLRHLHCDEAQGYHLSKPVPMEEFTLWCRQWAGSRGMPAGARALLH